MRSLLALTAAVALLAATPSAQSAPAEADAAAIRQTLLDYAEGYFGGEPARMARAVSPMLTKRMRTPDPGGVLTEMNAEMLIDVSNGVKLAPEARRITTEVLDITGDLASARAFTARFNDYVHLVRRDGRWQILNVLWHAPTTAPNPAGVDTAVTEAVRAYVAAWAAAGGAEFTALTHPLARLRTFATPPNRARVVSETSAPAVAMMMRMGQLRPSPADASGVRLLGVDGDIASARAVVNGAVQYLHLTKVGDGWRVVNVLADTPKAR